MHLTCTPLPQEDGGTSKEDVPLHTAFLIGKVCDSPRNEFMDMNIVSICVLVIKVVLIQSNFLHYF